MKVDKGKHKRMISQPDKKLQEKIDTLERKNNKILTQPSGR